MGTETANIENGLYWYKDAILYELHIKAFSDGNGDGIGDFKGLLEKLDYLQELGVTAIWVLPFYPSPLRDDGYDIADYYNINPSYGTIEQFKAFLEEAHKRNLKVITELVLNHTSDQHPWFQRARMAPKGSIERDYYVWTDNPHQYKDVRIIFQDFETSNWGWDPVAQQYYWHRFFHHQPDLNYDSPHVQEEVLRVLDFWCSMGVDGFRLDAVPYLFEREGTNGENLPETHAFLKKMRRYIDEKYPGTIFLAEANMWPEDSASYFGNGDECHMNYHFPVMPRMFMSLQMEDRYPITDIFDQTPAIPDNCQWAMFLRNHDELTLEMVTDEERDYMYKVYAKDPKAKINLGIRHRLAPLLDNNRRKIELMNCLLFSLPGTPVIYYGDEIGMGDNFYLGDRDGVRTPMQWTADRNAGFSLANPQKLYLPLILDPEYHYEAVNVETQRSNTSSLFWFMKRLINMRKQFKAFGRGDLRFLEVENPKILAFTRTYQNETLLIVANFSKFSQPAEVDMTAYKGCKPVEVVSKIHFPPIKEDGHYFFTMSPYGFQCFILEKAHPEIDKNAPLPVLRLEHWEDLLSSDHLFELEKRILPEYLLKTKWFGGKNRSVYAVTIAKHIQIPQAKQSAFLLLIEVSYQSGQPETYQLAVTFATDQDAAKLAHNCPQAVIAHVSSDTTSGVLCDALYIYEVQQRLFHNMAEDKLVLLGDSSIQFSGADMIKEYLKDTPDTKSKIHTSTESNTSVNYNNRFLFKLYRKIEQGLHPDLEITRLLSEQAHFECVPAYAGSIYWKGEHGNVLLGLMQVMVENHGDGYKYFTERLHNYRERILARDRNTLHPEERLGTLAQPRAYDQLSEEIQVLLGGPAAEQSRLIGIRTGQMHLALAGISHQDFLPEEFSLHYQRSLYSSMQSLVREAVQSIQRSLATLTPGLRAQADTVVNNRNRLLDTLKRIYTKKLDITKIRIHGNYHLGQILLTGKDIAIKDFAGGHSRSLSERRLKRSPFNDIAAMIACFYYTAYESLQDSPELLPFAAFWAYHQSGFFMHAYLETVEGASFMPVDKKELQMLLDTYLLQRALQDLASDITQRPASATGPLEIIKMVLG